MRISNMQLKKIGLFSLIGDVLIAILAYFFSRSSYAFTVSRYVAIDFLAILLMVIWPLIISTFFVLKEKYKINKYSLTWIFCLTLSFFVGIVFLAGVFTHGEAIRGNLHPDEMDAFMDFYNSIQFGMEPYKYKTIYPPFISALYGLIGQFVPAHVISEHAFEIRDSQMGSVIFVIYSVFLCSFLAWLICSFKRGGLIEKVCFTMILFFSRPFLFAFERGNSVILALFFIMLFLKWYDSSVTKLRLFAYIALGLATGIKIAPFILVLLILRRKEYLSTVIATAITAVLFFVPFFFTDGNIWTLAKNLSYTTSLFQGFVEIPNGTLRMTGYGGHVNFVNLMNFLGRALNFNAFYIGKYLNLLLLFLGSGVVLIKKDLEEWKAVAILMGLMILCPGFSGIYNLIYMIPPLILYLNHYEENHRPADGYLFLFIVMMVPFLKTKMLFPEDAYGVRIAALCEIVSANLLVIVLILFACYKLIKELPHRNMIGIALLILCLAGYPLYYKLQPASVDAFYPMNFAGGKAQVGVTMNQGFYKYIKSDAEFTLNREKIVQNGLTVTLVNNNEEANEYEIYSANKLLKQGIIGRHSKALVYIEGYFFKTGGNENHDRLSVEIKNKGQEPLTLQYVGVTKPLDKLVAATYIDNSSEGFIRAKNDNIQTSTDSRFLFSGKNLKRGILFKYYAPFELFNDNEGKEIVLGIYVNGNIVKKIPVISVGDHYEIVDQFPGVSINNINEVSFKLNAYYTNKQFDYNNDDKKRGIVIYYFGNVEKPYDVNEKFIKSVSSGEKKFIELFTTKEETYELASFGKKKIVEFTSSGEKIPAKLISNEKQELFELSSVGKRTWFYPEKSFSGKDFCIVYEKNRNPNKDLKFQVEINGRKEIKNIENSKFIELAAVVIPLTEFDLLRKISAINLKLLNGKEDDYVMIQYAGPSVLQQDVKAEQFAVDCQDKKRKVEPGCLKRTSGLNYDSAIKALRMDKKADILLDNRFMESKNLEIDFNILEGLPEYFGDEDKILEILLDNKSIMTVPLRSGKQKIIVSNKLWNRNIPVSTLSLKSTLFDLSKRVSLPRRLREHGVDISYIGVER